MHSQPDLSGNERFAADGAHDSGRRFQRMLNEQVGGAVDLLSKAHTEPTEIHEARKCMKRARAILRLLRSGLRSSSYRRADRALRDAARLLSATRDGDVVIRLIDALTLLPEAEDAKLLLARLRAPLLRRHERAESNFSKRRVQAIELLRAVIAQSPTWVPISSEWRVIGDGLQRTYRRGRKAYRAAVNEVDDEKLHAWRKQAKYSRYQLESLAEMMPRPMNKQIARLARLEHILGEDHDFALLHIAARQIGPSMPNRGRRRLDELIHHRRMQLQSAAFTLGAALYKPRPKQFVKRVRRHISRSADLQWL